MTATSSTAASDLRDALSRIEAKLDGLATQVVDIARIQAVQEHRVGQLEKTTMSNRNDIDSLEKSIERLETMVKAISAAGGTLATAGALWVVSQLLGLIK